jgi:hypothetical protein
MVKRRFPRPGSKSNDLRYLQPVAAENDNRFLGLMNIAHS